MRQILILKDLAYAAKVGGGAIIDANEIGVLAPGALAIFNDKNQLVTPANIATTLPDAKSVRYVLGGVDTAEGGIFSLPVERAVARYDAKNYSAPVKEVQFIGNDGLVGALNLPATLIAGTTANIRIIKSDSGQEIATDKFRYEYYVKAGDTNVEIVAGLVAKINADSSSPVTAAVVGASVGIELTAKEFGQVFEVGTDEVLEDATVVKGGTSNSVAIEFGCGTATQIAAMEEEFVAELGDTNKVWLRDKYFSKAPKVDPALTYDTYTINWTVKRRGTIVSLDATDQVLVVAMPDAATLQADFETLSAAIFGLAGGNEETGDDTAV